jgi:dTDP-4-dehydrorhamnose reductase
MGSAGLMAQRVLVLGVTGMLGHTLMNELDRAESLDVYGSARAEGLLPQFLSTDQLKRVILGVDALDLDTVRRVIRDLRPEVVVNCIGVIKQDPAIRDAVYTIRVNSLFPHLLARECAGVDARLINVGTDCVFSGNRGNYVETDTPDPIDLYGRSKLLGEVTTAPTLTLRTSVIGHELGTARSLVDWFLSQSGVVKGFTKAIYSGLTTIELGRLLAAVVFPQEDIVGLFHIASTPLSKFELLGMIAAVYGWTGELIRDSEVVYDRSLSPDAFCSLTSYRPPSWPEMIREMHGSAPAGHLGKARHV